MIEVHELGDERDLRLTTTVSGIPTDPTDLTFKIKEPDGVVTAFVKDEDIEVESPGAGIWRVLWICRQAGWHHVLMEATGNINQTEELAFYVQWSNVRSPANLLTAPEPSP